LPSVDLEMENIKEWLKLESNDQLNSLDKKGWIKRIGTKIKLHQVMKDTLIYHTKPDVKKCQNLISSIAEMLFCEPGENPLNKKGFLPFGDSILKYLTEKDQHIATLANNLSLIYSDLGQLEKALEYQMRALEIREKILDPDHPDLAQSYNDLSLNYLDLGQSEKALEYQRRALEIREKILDSDRPDLAQSYNNLSLIYSDLGQLEKATEFQLRANEIYEKILDPDHPSLATSYNNLSLIYKNLGQLEKAFEYMEKAIKILKVNFPDGHPNLDTALRSLEVIRQEKAK
jgi:tetratricopeptide (TPR) repeat protein